MKLITQRPRPDQEYLVCAELINSDVLTATGITVRNNTPVLVMCRSLIAAGMPPDQAIEIYRGATLALDEPIAWQRCEGVNAAEEESLKSILGKWGAPT